MLSMAFLIGRILLPVVFVVTGMQKLWDVSGIAKVLADNALPVPDVSSYLGGIPRYEAAGYFVGAVELVCGLMIMAGLLARWAALVLVLLTIATIVVVHHFWDMQGAAAASNQIQALKNLSIMGGLLLIVACGSGGRGWRG